MGAASTEKETPQCPSCGKKAVRPRKRTGDYRCSACGETFARSVIHTQEEERAEDPNIPVEEDRCPNCERKALAPRVRTNDFRCSACNTTFEQSEIDRHLLPQYEARLGLLLKKFFRHAIRRPPEKEKVEHEGPDVQPIINVAGALFLFGGPFAGCWWHATLGLGGLAGAGAGLGVGLVAIFVLSLVLNAISELIARPERNRLIAEAEEDFQRRSVEYERWKDEHEELRRLHEAYEAHPLPYSKLSTDLRQLLATAVRAEGTEEEVKTFERLRNEIEKRMPLDASQSPYRAEEGG